VYFDINWGVWVTILICVLLSGFCFSFYTWCSPTSFVEGSYVSPVTLKRGDLYIKGWVVDWWLCEFPSCMVDDPVDFIVRDYCSEIPLFGPSDVRFVRDV